MGNKAIFVWAGVGALLFVGVVVLYVSRTVDSSVGFGGEGGLGIELPIASAGGDGSLSASGDGRIEGTGSAEGVLLALKARLADGFSDHESAEVLGLLGQLFRLSPKDAFSLIENEPLLGSKKGLSLEAIKQAVLSGAVDHATLAEWMRTTKLDSIYVQHALTYAAERTTDGSAIRELLDIAKGRGQVSFGPLFESLFRRDAAAAMDLAHVLEAEGADAVTIGTIKSAIAEVMAETNCRDAYQYLMRERAAYSNMVDIIARWAVVSPKEVAGELPNMPADVLLSLVGTTEFFALMKGSLGNSSVLLDRLMLTPATKSNSGLLNQVAVNIARVDPKAACHFAESFENGPLRSNMIGKVFAGIADSDPKVARNMVMELKSEADRGLAYCGIASVIAARNFDSALDQVAAAPPSHQQDIYREIARTSAYQKPENAMRMLEDPVLSKEIGDGFRQEMLCTTVTTWAMRDLGAARRWVEKLPAGDAANGTQGLMTSWMKSDPVAASEWLSKQAPGSARDAGANVLIEQIRNTDPEMAEQWRRTLSSPAGK